MRTWLQLESVGKFIGISGAILLRTIWFVAALVVSKQRVVVGYTWLAQASTHSLRIGLPKCTASA